MCVIRDYADWMGEVDGVGRRRRRRSAKAALVEVRTTLQPDTHSKSNWHC
jgi:hypothetical protein